MNDGGYTPGGLVVAACGNPCPKMSQQHPGTIETRAGSDHATEHEQRRTRAAESGSLVDS